MARAQHTYSVRLAVDGGGKVKAELVEIGRSGERSLKTIESQGRRTALSLGGLTDKTRLLSSGLRGLGGALIGVSSAAGLIAFADRAITAADAIGKTADKIGVSVEALQELRYAAQSAGVAQNTLDMALQRFGRRAAEAANGTGEARKALEEMGIQLRDGSGAIRSTEDLLGDVAEAFARTHNPADRLRLAFKLFDSEGVAVVGMLREGRVALDSVRQRARDLGIVLDEALVRGAENARNELDTLTQVIKIHFTRAVLEVAPELADLSETLSASLPPALSLAADAARAFADRLAVVVGLVQAIRDLDVPGIFAALTWSPHRDWLLGQLGLAESAGGASGRWGPTGATGVWAPPPEALPSAGLAAVTTTGTAAPGSFRAAQEGVLSAQENAAAVAAGRYAAMLEQQQKLAQAAKEAEQAGAEAAREAARHARDEAEARGEALRTLEGLRDEYLRATDQQIALTLRRRDRELAALADLRLSEQELAAARMLIAATAAEEIAAINAGAAEDSQRAWEDFGRGVVSVFTSAALSADSFGAAVKRGLLQLAAAQAQRLWLDPLGDTLGDTLGGLLRGAVSGMSLFGGGGGGAAASSAVGSSGLTGGSFATGFLHGGGRVGLDPAPMRPMPAALFALAPRLHDGLAWDEYPAILQRGERVIPRNAPTTRPAAGSPVVVHMRIDARQADVAGFQRSAGQIARTLGRAIQREVR